MLTLVERHAIQCHFSAFERWQVWSDNLQRCNPTSLSISCTFKTHLANVLSTLHLTWMYLHMQALVTCLYVIVSIHVFHTGFVTPVIPPIPLMGLSNGSTDNRIGQRAEPKPMADIWDQEEGNKPGLQKEHARGARAPGVHDTLSGCWLNGGPKDEETCPARTQGGLPPGHRKEPCALKHRE